MGPEDDRTRSVSEGITRLAELVMSEETVQSVLDLVVDLVQKTIPVADGASVTVKRKDRFVTVAATSPALRTLDDLQYRSSGGPCVQAYRERQIVIAADLARDERWPDFARASSDEGFQSIMAIPLVPVLESIGTLNVYSSTHIGFDETNQQMATLLAHQAAIAIANSGSYVESEESNDQLREALASRDLIGQAKGILMERGELTGDEAFDEMRAESQKSNRKLRDIAEDIVRKVTERGTHD